MARVLKSDPFRKTCQEPTKDRTELKIELDDLSCESIFRNADLYTLNCKIKCTPVRVIRSQILSDVNSIYDPLGFVGTVKLQALRVLQKSWELEAT